MTAKEYLMQARRIDIQINFDLRELDHWRDLSGRITGCSFEPHYNPNRNIEAPFVRCLDKVVELEHKITQEVNRLVDLKSRMIDYQSVLELRYISYYTWEQIAAEMHYSLRWIYQLHGKALQAFEKIMESGKSAV